MDPNLNLAALVLFIKMDVHHPTTVKEIHIFLDIHTLGGNNAVNGMVVNANQRVTNAISFSMLKLEILQNLIY